MRDRRLRRAGPGPVALTLITTLSLILAGPALAHDWEPINTEYAPPVAFIVWDTTFSAFDAADGTRYSVPALGLEAPVGERTQFEVGIPVLAFDPEVGSGDTNFGDLEFGLRHQLLAEEIGGSLPDVDLNFELGVPTGDAASGLGGEAWEGAVGIFLTKHVGDATLFGNFSYAAEIPREATAQRENLFEFATATVWALNDRFRPTVEFFGEVNATEEETEAFVAPEMLVSLNDSWELKGAVPLGLTGSSSDVGAQVQLTYIFGHGH